jgi:hypothetical protein
LRSIQRGYFYTKQQYGTTWRLAARAEALSFQRVLARGMPASRYVSPPFFAFYFRDNY